jgi:uncharacterized protein YlxW (UPF0749 family)
MYEGRPLTKEDMWKKEVADMQKQVHTLQIRVKELSEELNKIKSINAEKSNDEPTQLEFNF